MSQKITSEELQLWYLERQTEYGFNWESIDTSAAVNYSDAELLGLISQLNLKSTPGYGLIAELCKRYNRS